MRRGFLLALFAAACSGGNVPPYAECSSNGDCAGPSDGCYEVLYTRDDGTAAGGPFCTLQCAGDEDCPDGGTCLALVGDPERRFICFDRCADSADCFSGLTCTMTAGGTATPACLPD